MVDSFSNDGYCNRCCHSVVCLSASHWTEWDTVKTWPEVTLVETGDSPLTSLAHHSKGRSAGRNHWSKFALQAAAKLSLDLEWCCLTPNDIGRCFLFRSLKVTRWSLRPRLLMPFKDMRTLEVVCLPMRLCFTANVCFSLCTYIVRILCMFKT